MNPLSFLGIGNKFSPKKGPPRKATSLSNLNLDATERQAEFGVDYGPVKLNLGENEISFDGTEWISGTTGAHKKREIEQLKKEKNALIEENNLLKVKVELLLDMLSERTAELHLQENELEQVKRTKIKRER